MPQIGNLLLCKGALLKLEKQLIVHQHLEYNSQMVQVLIQGFSEHKNVIHKYKYKFPHMWTKYCIHEALKSDRGIC
jgi:hypothetical protein